MKRINKIFILIGIFLIMLCPLVYAAPISIDETMSKEEIMEKYYELKEENQELVEKYNSLNQQWANEKIAIEKKKDSVDDEINRTNVRLDKIYIYGGAFGFALSIVLGVSMIGLIKDIKNKIKTSVENEVNNKVPEEVGRKLGREVECIKQMIDNSKREEKLMQEKEILVISENSEKQKEVESLLKKFKSPDYYRLGDRLHDLKRYDVILFNEIDGQAKEKELNEIINDNDSNINAVYFYFNTQRIRFNSNKPDNTNFSNSNSTFVGNLLDLMKYQDDILRN